VDSKHKYEIYDRKSGNLLAEGFLKERNGVYEAGMLIPNSENAVILVDGKVMRMCPSVPVRRPKPELVDNDQITNVYWSYGDERKPLKEQVTVGDDLVWKSKYYGDLNFHVETKDGNDGKLVELELEVGDNQTISLRGTISSNSLVFEKVFKEYLLN